MKIFIKTLSVFLFSLVVFNINNVSAQESLNPVILSISPNPAHEGDMITVTGKNLQYLSECNPFSGQTPAHPMFLIDGDDQYSISSGFSINTTWTNEKITTDLLTKPGKLQIRNCFNLLSNEFVVLPLLKRSLTLASVEPNSGIYPGSVITVNGRDLGNKMSVNDQFYLNGHYVDKSNISSWTNDNFKLRIPTEIGGQENIKGEVKVTPGNYELQIHSNYYSNPVDSNKISFAISNTPPKIVEETLPLRVPEQVPQTHNESVAPSNNEPVEKDTIMNLITKILIAILHKLQN